MTGLHLFPGHPWIYLMQYNAGCFSKGFRWLQNEAAHQDLLGDGGWSCDLQSELSLAGRYDPVASWHTPGRHRDPPLRRAPQSWWYNCLEIRMLNLNSLWPGKFNWNFRWVLFKPITMIDGWDTSCEIALRRISLDLTDDKSTLGQVMAWCHQATSHYLSQCWPRSLSPYAITRPQRINWYKTVILSAFCNGDMTTLH